MHVPVARHDVYWISLFSLICCAGRARFQGSINGSPRATSCEYCEQASVCRFRCWIWHSYSCLFLHDLCQTYFLHSFCYIIPSPLSWSVSGQAPEDPEAVTLPLHEEHILALHNLYFDHGTRSKHKICMQMEAIKPVSTRCLGQWTTCCY